MMMIDIFLQQHRTMVLLLLGLAPSLSAYILHNIGIVCLFCKLFLTHFSAVYDTSLLNTFTRFDAKDHHHKNKNNDTNGMEMERPKHDTYP